MRMKLPRMGVVLLFLALATLLFAGCTKSMDETPATTQEIRDPFSSRSESEDGAIVAWGGAAKGHTPGAAATFDVTIKNETGEIWHGRYCLQLLGRKSHKVITTLEQRPFTLEPGVGFSDVMDVRFPEDLAAGAYGLSMVVRRPGGPMVDLVPVQIGATEEVRQATTQQDMEAALAACPPVEGVDESVGLAKANLAQRLGISPADITVQNVEPTEFPDASLGVPEPGKTYAQVITPGYIVELSVEGQTYRYHASDERVIAVPEE